MGDLLVEKSFPISSPIDEEAISILKQRIITVDGYEITLYFNKCKYKNNIILNTVQIYSRNTSYLPFRLLCRIAKLFFGNEEPGFINLADPKNYGSPEARQVYIWTVYYDKNGIVSFKENSIFSELIRCEFEGFVYYKVDKINNDPIFF